MTTKRSIKAMFAVGDRWHVRSVHVASGRIVNERNIVIERISAQTIDTRSGSDNYGYMTWPEPSAIKTARPGFLHFTMYDAAYDVTLTKLDKEIKV